MQSTMFGSRASKRAVSCILAAGAFLFSFAVSQAVADAPPAAHEPAQNNAWRQMLLQDLSFAGDTLRHRYIYARTEGDVWDKQLTDAMAQAEGEADQIHDFAGYNAALVRFLGAFKDAHLGVHLNVELAAYNWPGFLVRYQRGTYVVVDSQIDAVRKDAIITACDGRPIQRIVDDIAPILSRVPGLESTSDTMARVLFIDARNPFYERPKHCDIGGAGVDLQWTPIPAARLTLLNEAHSLVYDSTTAITHFGRNGAWVRMPDFSPSTPREAAEFHSIISHAPEIRTSDVIVLDVRGNPGGPYNWFMGFLHGLYGADYADYYARARLQIRPVMLEDPRTAPNFMKGMSNRPGSNPLDMPPDLALNSVLKKIVPRPAAHGATVYVISPDDGPQAPLGPPPPNPVHGQVYVLTDYNCGSACIAFVDEMKRFPGVVQVGRETYVDSRSGTPTAYPLPSGNGDLFVPSMVREGRERGDNVPQRPTITYDGDITDTVALKEWIGTLSTNHPQ